MLASIYPTLSLRSNTNTRLGGDHRLPSAYYYRSKFLLAPDASALAQPPSIATRDDHQEQAPGGPNGSYSSFPLRPTVTQFNPITGSFTNVMARWTRITQRSANNGPTNDTTRVSPEKFDKVVFPSPPTLADIRRMEPDLSPVSAMRRAGDISSSRLAKLALPAFRASPADEWATHALVMISNSPTNESPHAIRSVKSEAHSPIAPPRKRPRTSSPQGSEAASSDESTSDDEIIFFCPKRTLTINNPETASLSTHQHERGVVQSTGPVTEPLKDAGVTVNYATIHLPATSAHTLPDSLVLAEWLSDYLFSVVTKEQSYGIGTTSPRTMLSPQARCNTAGRIHNVIADCRSSITVIFSCLWYISRLAPVGFVNAEDVHEGSIERLISRIFLLGMVLADKWLNDEPLLMKHWKLDSDLTLESLVKLEVNALLVLEYDLSISEDAWRNWLMDIRYHPTLHSQNQERRHLVSSLIDEALGRVFSNHRQRHGHYRAKPIARPPPASSLHSLHTKLVEGLAVTRTLPTSLPRSILHDSIREPAPWNPEADPIIGKSRNTSAIVPRAAPMKITPITASSILADILSKGPSPLIHVCRGFDRHGQMDSCWPTPIYHGYHDCSYSGYSLRPYPPGLTVEG